MLDWAEGFISFQYIYIWSITVCKDSVINWQGVVHLLTFIYKSSFRGMQGLCGPITWEIPLLPINIYIYIYMKCNSMQDHCDQLTGGFIFFLYTYMYKECRGMPGLCDQLTRGVISFLYISIYIYIWCVMVCKVSVINWPGVFTSLLYIYISSVVVCKSSVID